MDADEKSGLGTRDKKSSSRKLPFRNSSDSESEDADDSLRTPDCGIDNILALFQVLPEHSPSITSITKF
jgi:hypothetical protein